MLLLPLLCGCHFNFNFFKPKPKPPQHPQVVTQSRGPLSIVVNPYIGWAAAPAAVGTPVYTDTDDLITDFPQALTHTLIIQRPSLNNASVGYLNGQVKVPTDATLYVAILIEANGQTLVPNREFNAYRSEGWTQIFETFAITQPENGNYKWLLWSHPIPRGPINIVSDAIPAGGIFFIGRALAE